MAATGKTPILLYGSTTATNQPSAGNLTNSSDGCEIAINVADKNLFFKDSTNTVNTVPIRQSSASSDGWLSSTDWSTFNNKQPAGSYLTSVTVDAPLTGAGTSGSHLSIPAASGSTNGYLSSADWTTFNSKQPAGTYVTSVTGTAPVVSSGGTTPAISMAAASGSVNGYLTSTDWTTFNNKVSSQWVTTGSNIYYTAGLVGIGNTSPTAALDVSYGLASTASPVTYLSAANANDATAVEIRQGRYNKDALVITSNQTLSANFIRVSENGTDRFIVAGGGVGDVTVSTGNLIIGTSGKGIDFSATAGTGTSELLADYEEGTWTPSISAAGGSITSYTSSGYYTKVGRQVTVNGVFTITNNGTGAGGIVIASLPYTIANTIAGGSARENAVNGKMSSLSATSTSQLVMYTYDNLYPGGTSTSFQFSATYFN